MLFAIKFSSPVDIIAKKFYDSFHMLFYFFIVDLNNAKLCFQKAVNYDFSHTNALE